MRIAKTFIALSLCAATQAALAGPAVELKVSGTIAPGACVPTFNSNGLVDYGNLAHSDLSSDPTATTPLPTKNITFEIACSSATPIATNWIDNKPANNSSPDDHNYFGLGKDVAGNPLGRVWVQHVAGRAYGDGETLDVIHSLDKQTWFRNSWGQVSKTHYTSFAAQGELSPKAFKNYSGTLQLKPTVQATEHLDLSAAMEIEGSMTMEVNYL